MTACSLRATLFSFLSVITTPGAKVGGIERRQLANIATTTAGFCFFRDAQKPSAESRDPAIYLVPEADDTDDAEELLREVCGQIFTEQLESWIVDRRMWPKDRGFDAFCCWFDFQHHSMLIDLCDEPLIREI